MTTRAETVSLIITYQVDNVFIIKVIFKSRVLQVPAF